MLLIKNRRAKFDYQIKDSWLAGIVLAGHEVKSLRNKQASLEGSYVKIINQEAWLVNARVSPYRYAHLEDYDPKRTRKLLLSKKEIYQLIEAINSKNQVIIPLELTIINNHIKLKIGAGKGQKEFEKRAVIKSRELKRRMASEFKQSKLKL
jgi:SsrA-binding protein